MNKETQIGTPTQNPLTTLELIRIEEMAKEIDKSHWRVEQDFTGCHINSIEIAEALYKGNYRKIPSDIGEFSDGYHTFNELYHHRAELFSVICNMFPEKSWKSKLHDTGDMFDGMFIVGIETEYGQATYHYDIEPYWDMFKVKELEKAPKWDGHTSSDAIERIGNMSVKGYRKQSEGEWVFHKDGSGTCNQCGTTQKNIWDMDNYQSYCGHCGAKMKGGAE